MQKSNYKKIIIVMVIILTLILILGLITSCGNTKSDDNTATTENNNDVNAENESVYLITEAKILPDLPDVNYNGYKFTWLTYGGEGGNWATPDPRELAAAEENGDVINDSTYRRNSVITEKYGVEFEMVVTPDEKSMLNRSVKAGDDTYDAVLMYNNHAPAVMSSNLLLNTDQLSYINFDKPWWDSAIKETSILGRNFFLAGDIIILDKESINVLFFNKKQMSDMGMEFPYQSVLNGTWTYDKLEEYIKNGARDLNGDGKLKAGTDRFGLAIFNDSLHAFFVSGGGLLAKNGPDGVPYPAFNNAENVALLNSIADFMYGKEYITNYHTNGQGNIIEMKQSFYDGLTFILWGRLFVLDALRNMDDDFGILPLPKYNENQTQYYSNVNSYTGAMIGVPKSASDPDRTSIILEALAAESRYTLFPAYYEITLQRKFTRDDESAAMLDIIFSTTVYDTGAAYNIGDIWMTMFNMCGKEDRNFASFMEKNEPKVQKAIEKLIKSVENED